MFLLHGKDSGQCGDFLTLEEAMAQKQVILKETGQVSELQINNLGDKAVFIQSGDIVMGGKQDRTLQFDMILCPKSGFVPIKSFCVEQGRWRKRATEDEASFHSSSHYASHKNIRMAAKYSHDQSEVWRQVSSFQTMNAFNLNMSVQDSVGHESPSSLPLSMENEHVQKATDKYISDLANLLEKENDVIGYAFAINGEVSNIDVYASATLFKKMWPKLLKAAASEAFTEKQQGKDFAPPSAEKVQQCMADAEQGKAQEKGIAGKTRTVMKESPLNVLFETRDTANGDMWVHRNYVSKETPQKAS